MDVAPLQTCSACPSKYLKGSFARRDAVSAFELLSHSNASLAKSNDSLVGNRLMGKLMGTYMVIVEETVTGTFAVEADSAEEAVCIARQRYRECLLVLEPGEVQDV